MKPARTLVTLLAAVATFAAAAAAASASPRTTAPLQLLSVQRSFSMPGKAGPHQMPKVGDRMIFDDTLYNHAAQLGKPSGARVGHAEGVCTLSAARMLQCLVTAHLPNGEIVAVLAFPVHDGPQTNTAAIIGGTGAYSSATGTVLSRDLSQTKSLLTIRITA
jgi:hypothetical protein